MKRTEYFATIEEANQYYPDGVPSSVIAIVGDGSQVLVSSDNAATNTQQYYSADLTNDEIVNTMVQNSYDAGETAGYTAGETAGYNTGYTAGETAGYNSGYAAGEAAGATNWLDVLYLDEKAKAESFLGETLENSFFKYNFAKYATSQPFIDRASALAFISGLQTNSTMWKLIKISKDADDNAVITYNTCSINYDGENVGAIALDGVTYYNKICLWGTLTLAAGDEVIMSCATNVPNTITVGLFGGFDDETNDPATYKCETAGTYTFGLWADVPAVTEGNAACFVSTMFNYEGSATVPAITVPTGEPSSGSSEPTAEELDQQAYLFFTQGPGYENTNEVMNYVTACGNQVEDLETVDTTLFRSYLNDALTFSNSDFPYTLYTTLYDPTQTPEFQWGTFSGYLTPTFNYSTDPNTGAPIVTMTFTASNNSKIGFGLLPLKYDAETGVTEVDTDIQTISTFLKCFDNGEVDESNYTIYRHLTDVEAGKTYTATFSTTTDPETGVDMPSITLQEVQS